MLKLLFCMSILLLLSPGTRAALDLASIIDRIFDLFPLLGDLFGSLGGSGGALGGARDGGREGARWSWRDRVSGGARGGATDRGSEGAQGSSGDRGSQQESTDSNQDSRPSLSPDISSVIDRIRDFLPLLGDLSGSAIGSGGARGSATDGESEGAQGSSGDRGSQQESTDSNQDSRSTLSSGSSYEGNLVDLATYLRDKTLVDAVKKADLVDTLSAPGSLTVFGPSNEAFRKLSRAERRSLLFDESKLKDVLKYHVTASPLRSSELKNDQLVPSLNGQDIRINIYGQKITACGCEVTLADLSATNGIFHSINRVMVPPQDSIAEIISKDSEYSTLKELLKKVRLEDTFKGTGPFTLFAPTNAAFAELPESAMKRLKTRSAFTKQILSYHAVGSTFYSVGLSSGQKLLTLQGELVPISLTNGGAKVDEATVTVADTTATNGVVHKINKVLLPPSF